VAGIGSLNLIGFTVFFLPISQELGISRAVTSMAPSISRLEGGLLGPIGGWAMDRFGPGRVMAFGSVMAGTGFILLATAVHHPASLFLVYGLVIGVGFNFGFFPAVMAAVNAWFIRRRTLAMSMVNAAWGGLAFLIVPLLSLIVAVYGWRTAALAAGLVIMCTAVPALLLIRRSPESMGLLPDGDDTNGAASRETEQAEAAPLRPWTDAMPPDVPVRRALRTPVFWLLVVASNLRFAAYTAVLVHFVPLLVWKGLTEQQAAFLIGLWSLLVIPSSLVSGFLADRWDKRAFISVGMLVGTAAFLLLALAQHPAFLYLAAVLLALFDNLGVVNSSLIGDYFGRRNFATLRGLMTGIGTTAVALSPVFAGWVWDRTGSYLPALLPLACGLVLSAGLYGLLRAAFPPARVREAAAG
jgi:MFS family permease